MGPMSIGPAPRSATSPATAKTLPAAGRFAPSPSGDLHIGNVRSGILAYLFAKTSGRDFLWRVEDLDRVKRGAAERQLADMAGLGIVPDAPPVYQSHRTAHYAEALERLAEHGLVYECYCSRKDIQQAPTAPHQPPGAYPGTCRDLDPAVREAERRRLAAAGRLPALRLRSDLAVHHITDVLLGPVQSTVDDFVLRRGDGVWAYNLAVVVDDGLMGVDQVVRADDLADSAPRQAYLADLLGFRKPTYAHVPLVLGPTGARLAKRDGAVTLRQLGDTDFDIWSWTGTSLGFGPWHSLDEAVARFDPERMVECPTTFIPPARA
jgi:glutamyl-tRNA synthetase